MILAYSYRHFPNTDAFELQRTIDFYKLSIFKAKQLGYEVHMFTDKPDMFEADRTIICNPDFCGYFWDNFKYIALGRLEEDYLLIDGDVILSERLKLPEVDVVYDADEPGEWKNGYREGVKLLTELGIDKVIPEWNPNRLVSKCVGLLRVTNPLFRSTYYDRWKTVHRFIEDNIKEYDPVLTGVAAEYLLACMIDKYDTSHSALSEELGSQNRYYRHYCGDLKWNEDLIDLSVDNHSISLT